MQSPLSFSLCCGSSVWLHTSVAFFLLVPVVLASRNVVSLKDNRPAEHVVLLRNRFEVLSHDYAGIDDATNAAALIQTREARISQHHHEKLQAAHNLLRYTQYQTPGFLQRRSQNLDDAITGDDATLQYNAVRMKNLKDSQYVGPVYVGAMRDELDAVFDTGSTNIWLASTLCTEGSCTKRHRYNPRTSKSYQSRNYALKVTFGTGELSGEQGVDDIGMGNFTVKGQTFSLIEKEKGDIFDKLDFEGILGLAFPSMSANGVVPFFDQVMKQKLLKDNTFSFYFTRLPTDASAVFFGKVNPMLHKGPLTPLPVTEQHYWMVGLNDLFIGDKRVEEGPKKVVMDTGTTYFTGPRSLLESSSSPILRHMPRTNCDALRGSSHNLPNMTFSLAGRGGKAVNLTITPKEYYVGSGASGECDPAWMPIEVPSPHGPAYILGEVFMRTFFTAFARGDGVSEQPEVWIGRQNQDEKVIDMMRKLKRDTDQ